MPLGTFAVSSSQQEANPDRVVQLAVDKDGVVSGTLYNEATDQARKPCLVESTRTPNAWRYE